MSVKHDLFLISLHKEQTEVPDDCGMSLQFIADTFLKHLAWTYGELFLTFLLWLCSEIRGLE